MRAWIPVSAVWPRALSNKVAVSIRPGLRLGPAPMRYVPESSRTVFDRIALRIMARVDAWYVAFIVGRQSRKLAERIEYLSAKDTNAMYAARTKLCAGVGVSGHNDMSLIDGLAHAIIAAEHTLKLSAHRGQRIAALSLLQERFVEMPTGEGKTLAVALASAVSALDGTPVHVITANDYLVARDARQLKPFYAAMGLSAAYVLPDMDDDARRVAYLCDIVYVTGKQVAFDWLRDELNSGSNSNSLTARLGELTRFNAESRAALPLLRGLCFAIVDEADSLLIDDARTPVVLATERTGTAYASAEMVIALGLAQLLKKGIDFSIKTSDQSVELTFEGEDTLQLYAKHFPGTWQAARYRNEQVRQALIALHLLHRDKDYIVRNDKIALIDEQSGRTLPDRRLQHGLQHFLELKEQCKENPESDVVAAIAFQHFFGHYLRLTGTSGTLSEVRDELACIYRASLIHIPPEYPSRWCEWAPVIVSTRASQLEALVDEVKRCRAQQRPVLIGTRSVEQSVGVASMLVACQIPHRVLNASNDHDEAGTVALAGEASQVTVATNMAGRGTDIPLGVGVADYGGLHIVSLAFNDARRIDRQLAGRTARQGQPGSFRRIVSLDDSELVDAMPHVLLAGARRAIRSICPHTGINNHYKTGFIFKIVVMLIRLTQRRIERRHSYSLRLTFESRELLAHHVAIGGQLEGRT